MTLENNSGCLPAFVRVLQRFFAPGAAMPLPYKRKDYFLSKAETSFFGVLRNVVGDRYLVFAKVRMEDVIVVKGATDQKGPDSRTSHRNRIKSRHVDFLLCDKDTSRPLLAIELDDSSHSRPAQRTRDEFVGKAFEAAGMPLLRVTAQRAYNVAEIRGRITQEIGRN